MKILKIYCLSIICLCLLGCDCQNHKQVNKPIHTHNFGPYGEIVQWKHWANGVGEYQFRYCTNCGVAEKRYL